ncbi:hypothetical protein O0L34_g18727 [Tuta absoluta]|nr:hypothetical protein O0L34_g18727 [Tuta absoluta]
MGLTNLVPLVLLISAGFGNTQTIPVVDVSVDANVAKPLRSIINDKFDAQNQNKDVLIDMLEAKLKEAVKKTNLQKKKTNERTLGSEDGISPLGTFPPETGVKCDALKNLQLQLKSNGISGVGEVGLMLKYGSLGKGSLKIETSGISNVGKAIVDLQALDGNIFVPGLSNLFSGKTLCDSHQAAEVMPTDPNKVLPVSQFDLLSRRNTNDTGNIDTGVASSIVGNGTVASKDLSLPVNAAVIPAVGGAVASPETPVAPGASVAKVASVPAVAAILPVVSGPIAH